MIFGRQILGRRQVDPAVLTTLQQLQVEGTFVTGTHLITVDQPISSDEGDLRKALYGSYLPVPSMEEFPPFDDAAYEDRNKPELLLLQKPTRLSSTQVGTGSRSRSPTEVIERFR
jgi:urease